MWRTIKAVSQLAVIAMAMWGGVQGAVTYEFALGVALVAYLGAESIEQILAAVGTKADTIKREPDGGTERALTTDHEHQDEDHKQVPIETTNED